MTRTYAKPTGRGNSPALAPGLARGFAAMACALALAGCAADALKQAPEAANAPWTAPVASDGEIVAGEKAPASQPRTTDFTLPANEKLMEPPPPGAVDLRKVYDLADLIDVAQSNNQLTRVAWNNAREAALAAGVVRSSYLPRVMASAVGGYSYSHSRNTTTLGLDGLGELPSSTSSSNTRLRGGVGNISLNWLLFDFGQRAAAVDAANQASVIANIGFTGAHQQLIYDVSLAFYACSAERMKVAANRRSLENARQVETAAQAKAGQGEGTVMDTAEARQGVAQAKLALTQSEGAAQNAYLRLVSTLGVSPMTKIRIADAQGRKLSPALGRSAERVVREALGRRPDVLAAYAGEQASRANIRAAEADFLPKIFLSGSANYNVGGLSLTAVPGVGSEQASSNLSGGRYGGSVLLGATMPLYDGGVRDAVLRQAQSKADTASLQLARTRNEAIRQIVAADNALKTSLSAYSAARELESASQTVFDAALAAYRNGVGTSTALVLAQTRLVQARLAAAEAYSASLSTAAALALATGSLGSAPL